MAPSSRPQSGIHLLTVVIGIALLLTALPVAAQSPVAQPVAQPQIKLIHLYEHTCPAGVDPTVGTVIDAIGVCPQAAPNVAFTLTSQDPTFAPQTHPTDSLGATEWHEIPSTAPYAIQQTVPAGYDSPVVRCQFGMHFDPSFGYMEQTLSAPGGRLDIGVTDPTLTGYGDVSCYWFDLPSRPPDAQGESVAQQPEAAVAESPDAAQAEASPPSAAQGAQPEGTRLDIRAWECPFHYDAAIATVDELLANCTRPDRDANFIINGDPATQQYTGSIGATSYQNVPFGTVTIQQLAAASFDPVRVFCYTQPFTASHGPLQASQEIGFTEEPGDTFSVSITVNPGDAIDCIWFDSWLTEDEYGTVLLHKYVCPDGTNTAAFDMDLLLHACPEPQVAYFELLFPGGSSAGNETDSDGYLGFINFGPGSFTIRETAPLGYSSARIFCRTYNADDWNHIVDPWVEQTVVNNTGFVANVQAHFETECNWFDVKGLNYGYLDITARSCPLTFAPTADTPRLTYAQQCQAGISGAMFELSSNANFDLSATSTDGYALFQEHVPVGYLSISSTGPQAYSVMKTFCGDAPFIGIGAIPTNWKPFNGGFVLYNVPLDYQVVCEYYFRPIAIVDTGVASPEADGSAADENAAGDESAATEASPAADVSTTDENTTADESAGAGASPTTDATEESSSGSGSDNGTTQSGTGGQSGGSSTNQGSSGGTTEPSQTSENANATATLALVAFSCPPGYDLYSADMAPSGDCPDPAIGIDFTMTGPDGSAHQAASNAGGELSLTDLPPGSYVLRAALPPEIESAFIANCVSDQRDLSSESPFIPVAYAGPDGQIGVTLLPGEALACSWYDIPAGQGATVTGQLFTCPGTTVIKTQCAPGTGPASLTFEPAPGQSGTPFDLQFGDDGSAQGTAPAGTYALTGIPIDACLVESDGFDASGQLVLAEGATVEVRIYTCGGS